MALIWSLRMRIVNYSQTQRTAQIEAIFKSFDFHYEDLTCL
jgi:hypothetical protein